MTPILLLVLASALATPPPMPRMWRVGGGALISFVDARFDVAPPTMEPGVDFLLTADATGDRFFVRAPVQIPDGVEIRGLHVWGNQQANDVNQMDCDLNRTDNFGNGITLANAISPGVGAPLDYEVVTNILDLEIVDNFAFSYNVQCLIDNNGQGLGSSTLYAIGVRFRGPPGGFTP